MTDNEIIAALARENVKLRAKVEQLEDTARRRTSWMDEAKEAAGYDTMVSFDVVWKAALEALNEKRSK